MALLELKNVTKDFGGLRALNNVSAEVNEGTIVGLIGPNGAGKTTLFNIVSGFYKPTGGRILSNGKDITKLKPHQITSKGIVRTFQETNLFYDFSVERNIYIACHLELHKSFFEELFETPSARNRLRIINNRIKEILELLGLNPVKDELAKNLPHGFQRVVGVGIALAASPKLLLLDEPFSGMNAEEKKTMMIHLTRIHNEKKVTIFLVEHDMKAVMGLCEYIIALNFGEKIGEGSPKEIQRNQAVIEAYLGVAEDVI